MCVVIAMYTVRGVPMFRHIASPSAVNNVSCVHTKFLNVVIRLTHHVGVGGSNIKFCNPRDIPQASKL